MNRRRALSLSVVAALGFALLPAIAPAQQKSLKEQLIGTWTMVSNDNIGADGVKRQLFGRNPKGITVYEAGGRYVQIMLQSDIPNFKINNRLEGTAEENRTVVHGSAASFGTWSFDEENRILVVRLEGSIFPNLAGTTSKRSVSITGDELRISNPTAGSGGKAEQVWRRAK
jgi:hypothetical protein